MSRKKSTPFAMDSNDRLFVKLKSLMHPMCALVDGLSITFFGKEKTAYLEIDRAIEWCHNEIKYSSDKKRFELILQALESAKLKTASVKFIENKDGKGE